MSTHMETINALEAVFNDFSRDPAQRVGAAQTIANQVGYRAAFAAMCDLHMIASTRLHFSSKDEAVQHG